MAAPLCAEVRQALEREGARAGDVRVRVACLAEDRRGARLSLAAVGANARRASEDSTTVGYVEPRGPATRFSRPILEGAGIALVVSESGEAAIGEILQAVEAADSGSLRDAVAEAAG